MNLSPQLLEEMTNMSGEPTVYLNPESGKFILLFDLKIEIFIYICLLMLSQAIK